MKDILSQKKIYINDDELIVGNLTFQSLAVSVFSEFSYSWIINEMENFPFSLNSVGLTLP